MRRRLRDERGASAVEFAFIVPLLIVLVLGIAEFGHAFQVQGTLSAAAREGVRAMALRSNPDDARDVVRNAADSLDPAITNNQIRITFIDARTGAARASCPTTGGSETAVRLAISYPMPFLTDFFGSGLTLTGSTGLPCNG